MGQKVIRAALALVCCATVANAESYGPILRVLDGDTYDVAAPLLPDELGDKVSIRVMGIDTPEHGFRAKCPAEAALADKATAFVKERMAAAGSIKVTIRQFDKYGGRVLGDVLLDGVSIGDMLIGAGLARAYHGEAKSSWCH